GHCRSPALLLAREELLDVLAAELGAFDDGVADAGEHLLEPRTDLALADLLGAALDPLGRLVDLGLVGGVGGTAGQRYRGEECESDPRRVKFRFHDAPPSAGFVGNSMLPPARFPRCPGSCRLPENFLSASMTLCPDGPVTGLTAGRGAYAQ